MLVLLIPMISCKTGWRFSNLVYSCTLIVVFTNLTSDTGWNGWHEKVRRKLALEVDDRSQFFVHGKLYTLFLVFHDGLKISYDIIQIYASNTHIWFGRACKIKIIHYELTWEVKYVLDQEYVRRYKKIILIKIQLVYGRNLRVPYWTKLCDRKH